MLKKEWISNIELYSDKWRDERLGKFTASEMHKIMGERGMGETGLTYIRERIGEELSGKPCREEINTPAIQWGRDNEIHAIRAFIEKNKDQYPILEHRVIQCMITEPDSRFSCTPDIIIPISEENGTWEVEVAETKCYQLSNHLACAECDTPAQLKKEDSKVFWQLITQMQICDALKGYAVFYNPTLRAASLKIITFEMLELREEFKLLKKRQKEAIDIFNEKRDKLLKI